MPSSPTRRVALLSTLALSATSIAACALTAGPAAAAGSTLSVRAKGTSAGGVAPHLDIYVAGVKVAGLNVTNTSWTVRTLPLQRPIPAGARVDLVFTNDAVVRGADRNLYVSQVSSGGATLTAAAMRYDRGAGYAGATDGVDVLTGTTSLYWGGALRGSWPGTPQVLPPASTGPATPAPKPQTPSPQAPSPQAPSPQAPTPQAPAQPASGASYTGKLPDGTSAKVFGPSSFWYRKLPANAPLDPNSGAIVANLYRTATKQYAADYWHPKFVPSVSPKAVINRSAYTPGVFVARNSDPVASFRWSNCQKSADMAMGRNLINTQLTAIHLPANAKPAAGSDAEMIVYNKDTGSLTDVFQARRLAGNSWSACWAGTLPKAAASIGAFSATYGASASGLPLLGGLLLPSELAAGRIDHVVGVSLPPNLVNRKVSSPARRTDGWSTGTATVSEGQYLRLPSTLNVDALKLSPATRTLAKAAQTYGLVVWDRSPSITFRAANVSSFSKNPYPTLIPRDWYELMGDKDKGHAAFPWDKLQVVARHYVQP